MINFGILGFSEDEFNAIVNFLVNEKWNKTQKLWNDSWLSACFNCFDKVKELLK